ncbi:MAG: acyl-CoA dehydrogenase family protein [Bacillota bacterium]|nr:acyl-CoA dehydrogenase family protein [Bacillota bacterium]
MDFAYTSDQRMLREVAAQVAGRFGDDYWQRIDEESRFPREFWDLLAAQELLGVAVPQEYGGSGMGLLEVAVLAEALAEHGAGMDGGGLFVNGPVFGGFLLTRHGSAGQRERYLPGLVRGEVWAGAFTEPDAGSNVSNIGTVAERRPDGRYRVTGSKIFISQMAVANHVVILARTSPREASQRTHGLSLFIADLPDPHIEFRPFKKLGSHFMDTNAVFIDGVEVPDDNLVGPLGEAWGPLYDVLNPERIVLAAVAVGTGMLALRKAVDFAKERKVWGDRPVGSYQGIQFPLAKARMRLAAARLKVYEAAWLYDRRSPECGLAAAMAKYEAAHAALEAADCAIQTLGGSGYIRDYGLERHWRNLRLNRIAPVTDEMTLNFVAQHDLGLPRSY